MTPPTAAPPHTTSTNWPASDHALVDSPPTYASTSVSATIEVPSLNKLSASMSVVSRGETPSFRNKLTTAIGSVADTNDANTTPSVQVKSRANPKTCNGHTVNRAVSAIAINRPGPASAATVRQLSRSSRTRMLYAASNTSPGRKTENNSSFVRCGGSTMRSEPTASPTATSAMVYGTRVRLTAIATAVAIANRMMKVCSTNALYC